jgi:hypothetical protein
MHPLLMRGPRTVDHAVDILPAVGLGMQFWRSLYDIMPCLGLGYGEWLFPRLWDESRRRETRQSGSKPVGGHQAHQLSGNQW